MHWEVYTYGLKYAEVYLEINCKLYLDNILKRLLFHTKE